MTDLKAESLSRIKTKCVIPNATMVRWLQGIFPELAGDAKVTSAYSYNMGPCEFEIEHTFQPPKPAGPILLAPVTLPGFSPDGPVVDADFEVEANGSESDSEQEGGTADPTTLEKPDGTEE